MMIEDKDDLEKQIDESINQYTRGIGIAMRYGFVLETYRVVCERAEKIIESTGKLEGAHYAALREYKDEVEREFFKLEDELKKEAKV